jgi:hypothetical protein
MSFLKYLALFTFAAAGSASAATMPRYDHILIIVAENKAYSEIIGNTADAPNLNALAKTYGLATNFYGEVHPSEANYVAMLGGDTFGIHDDDAWYCQPAQHAPFCDNAATVGYPSHSVSARSLMDQLQEAKLTWKGYFEDIPAAGSMVVYDPSPERKDSKRPLSLYASKHNGFLNFERVRQDPHIAEKIVPLSQLATDLAAGALPNYAHIVLNQCNEMHGLTGENVPSDCVLDDEKPETLHPVIRRGDKAIGALVDHIVAAPVWSTARNIAVVITWDEDDRDTTSVQGCCGFEPGSTANFGGGHIATIVITNHGPRGVTDPTPYNHYSLLRTCEEAFGMNEFLGFASADEKGVKAMTPLFEISGK